MSCYNQRCKNKCNDIYGQAACIRFMTYKQYQEYLEIDKSNKVRAKLVNKGKEVSIELDTESGRWEVI